MEIIFHIGMGKTGTSSIQKALTENADELRKQGVDYLGMWFSLIDTKFEGNIGNRKFLASTAEEMQLHADQFIQALQKRKSERGVSTFVLSNESLYGGHASISPFLTVLRKLADVRLIAYARDPREWLPSAYNQWAIYHKVEPGSIKPYAEAAHEHIKIYAVLQRWAGSFGDIFTLRPFSKSMDVVKDFASVLGFEMPISIDRVFERTEISESLLRAIYNSRFPGEVFPDKFDRAFRRLDFTRSPSITDLVRNSFTYDETNEIVAEQAALFEDINNSLGIDLLSGPAPAQKTVDPEEMRNRALEHVLQIVMQQADRIQALENVVKRLEKANNGR